MSNVGEMIANFALHLFGLNESLKKKKIDIDFEDVKFEDIELGNVTRKLEVMGIQEKYVDCQFKSMLQYPDLELGFGPIIEIGHKDVFIDTIAFEKCKTYENYISFMECISYLSTPCKFKY